MSARTARRSRARIALVVFVPLFMLLAIELFLRLFGVARPQPLFVSGDTGEYAPNPSYGLALPTFLNAGPPSDARMALVKDPAVCRVFLIGESTVAGFGLYPYSHIAGWMAIRLKQLLPEQQFEIVNLGIPGIDSSGLRYVVQDALVYQPDVLVIYAGHNEFLEPNLFRIRQPFAWFWRTLAHDVRLVNALRKLLYPTQRVSVPAPAPRGQGPVFDAPLISATETERLLADYEANLAAMVSNAKARGVQVVLCTPASNLRFPPMFASFSRELSPADAERVRLTCLAARSALEHAPSAEEIARQREALASASRLDPDVSLLAYLVGRAEDLAGDTHAAASDYGRARDLDGRPHRASSAILEAARRVAHRFQVPLVECAGRLDELTFAAPLDASRAERLFIDHCHPGVRAQCVIAGMIVQGMADVGAPRPRAAWRFDTEPTVDSYLEAHPVPAVRIAEIQYRQAIAHLRKWLRATATGAELEVARSAAELAVTFSPDRPAYHGMLGVLDALAGERESAAEHLGIYQRKDPESLTDIAELVEKSPELRAVFARAGLHVIGGRFELKP
jgi:lysophospholipase L1-like esterase